MNNEKNTKDELLTKLDEMRRRMAQLERDLSECRRTQENQPQGEGEFRRLLGEISEGTAIVVDGKNRWVNKAFGDVFGYAGEELTGKRVDFLLAPEELPHSLEHMNATLAGRDVPSHYETLAVRRDGQVINIDVSAKAVSFEGKKALQIVVRDITQHKQAEKLIRHRLEFERLISSISTRFINVTDFDESMNSSLAEIGSFSKVSRAYLFVIRDDGHTIDNTHEWCAEGVSPEIHNLQNMDLDNSPWWMSQLGKGETLPIDVSTLPPEAKPEREALEAQGIKSLLVLSLTLFGKLTGYIGFDSVAEARQWNDDDVLLLRMYSGVVGNALERKRVWAELQRREQHFRSLIEKSSDAVVIIGGDGVIRYESPSYEHMLGYRPGERAQGHFLERINPEDATKATDSFTRQLANPRDTAQIEMRVRNRDGDWRVIEATSTNLLSDPAVGGLVINMHDITERKRAENIIERRLTLEKAISTISSRFIDVVDIDAAIEATLADIGRLTGAERAYLFLLRTGSRTTERTYEWCADGIRPLKDKLVGISIDRSPWWRRELRHNRAVYVKDFSALPPEAKAQTLGLGIDKIRSLLLLPMSVAGEVRGLMGFDNAGRTKDWNDDDLSLMRTCSEIVGLALNRRQAEDALRESEAKYSTLVEQAEDGVLIVQDGVCVFANTAASKAMGYAPEGLHGKPFLDLAAPDSRQAAAERYAAWQAGNQVTNPFELRVIAHDGSVRETEAHTATIQYRGRPALMAVARDVTGRKRALAALQESERRYRLLAENASDVIWIVDGKLQFTYISPSVTRLRGFSVEEAAAQTFEQMIAPSSLATIMALVAEDRPAGETESREGNDTVSPETELTCKDGSTIWTENRVTLLHDSDGRVTGYLGASRDITQRKRAQDALRESEAKYSALVEQAKDAVFILQDHICQFSNNAVEKISGYHVDELQGKPYLHLLSPRSRDLIVQRNQLRELSQEVPSVLEVEVICKDGTLKPVEVSAGIIRYGGRPAHMAIVRDITERKRAERALRDSERRYRLLAENISDAIWVMDTRLRFTYVSPSVTRLLSYSVEEALPKTIHDLVAPGSLGVVLEAVARERAQQQAEKEPQYRAETLELEMRRRDGTTVWTENNVGLVRDADGSVTGYLGVSRDVTERRRAQQALRDGEETMRSLIENSPDIIATVGQDGIIQYANRSVAGITVEDVVGKTPYEFLLPAYHEPFRARMAKTFETGRGEPLETEGLGPNGIVARYETRFGSIRRGEHIAAITMIISDITERKRAERERVEHAMALARAEELQISRRRIVMAQETVRRDIAQKLHGSVQNRLIVLLHNLTEMEHSASSDRLSAQLRELHQRLKEVLDDHIRPISRRLYPSILRQGLVPALQSLGDQFESVLPIEMKLDSELVEEERINRKLVPEQVRLAAYRIAEEALANAAKHAKPYRVDVALERLPDGKLRLTVQDNGQGFAIETVPAGLGILMMQDYAEVAGGTCVVHSAPGEGTSVMTVFALEEPG